MKFGEDEHTEVYFKNKYAIETANTNEELSHYVDNNENPGNEKQVSHIVLYKKADILKNGLTIVDLPGAGSLTAVNEETTNRYIQNLCTAIFVIPTTPTIRKLESVFIKSVWMQFPTAVFVQNRREVEEFVEFNGKVLKKSHRK